jgi:hypothetical protein
MMKVRPTMTTTEEVVTPEQAKRWLLKNTRNRPVNRAKVKRYVLAMQQKRWTLHHQGLAFDDTGKLADGQHRLLAVVESNLPQTFLITRGVPAKALLTIDVDGHRRAYDNFHIEGYEHPKDRAARCLALLWLEQPGIYKNVPYYELRAVSNFYKEGLDWSLATCPTKPIIGTVGTTAVLAYAYKKNPKRVEAFARKLYTAEGFQQGEPEHTFHRYLMNRGAGRAGGGAYVEVHCAALQAIHAACTGQTLQRLNTGFANHPRFRTKRDEMLSYFADAYPRARKRPLLIDVTPTPAPLIEIPNTRA